MWRWVLAGWFFLFAVFACLVLFRGPLNRLHPLPAEIVPLGEPFRAASPSESISGNPVLPDDQIDLNLASEADLANLPGIGPVLADRIVRHRADHGPFRTPEDLSEVPGLGPKRVSVLSRLLTKRS